MWDHRLQETLSALEKTATAITDTPVEAVLKSLDVEDKASLPSEAASVSPVLSVGWWVTEKRDGSMRL